MNFREAIASYVRAEAKPQDKFSHQPRLYELARLLGQDYPHDDDVLYASAWLHDVGVFIGHRPENKVELAAWDHVAYAVSRIPGLLESWGFPAGKIPAVVESIRTHLPSGQPTLMEGVLLRDADILEQLGATGILRIVSKVGRDTRYYTHGDALRVLRKNATDLPGQLRLPLARRMADELIPVMQAFLACADKQSCAVPW